MGGSSSVRGDQTIYHTDNMCFDGTDRGSPMALNGQLWIGSTASDRPDNGGHVRLGSLTSPDASITIGYSAPNITLQAGPSVGTLRTITPNEDFDGSLATPISGIAGNINAFGVNPSFATVTETLNSTGLATGNLQVEHRAWTTGLVVDTSTTPGTRGTFATLAAAMAAAVAGQTIFLRTSVTENVTITPGVNIAGWSASALNLPAVIGTLTMSAAGTSTISGIRLQTNSANSVVVSGSAASILNLNNCFIDATNATAISFTAADTGAKINLNFCRGNIGTTGIAIITSTSTGAVLFNNDYFDNIGGSSTANSTSAGLFNAIGTTFSNPVTSTSTGSVSFQGCAIQTSAQNATSLTANGTGGSGVFSSLLSSGSASAISIGAGVTLSISLSSLISSNANTVTGSGIVQFSGITQGVTPGSINPTGKQGGTLLGVTNGTAVAAGYLGQQISSIFTGVALSNATPVSVANIVLTPGIWDISAISEPSFTLLSTSTNLSISTVTNTLQGGIGDQQVGMSWSSGTHNVVTMVIPAFRVTISANTTYFCVVQGNFSTGVSSTSGRISAVRVG